MLHAYIENYYNEIYTDEDSIEIKQFKTFVANFSHLIAYRTEWTIYNEDIQICGSIDMVFFNTHTNSFEIYDWKRVREIKYEPFKNQTAIVPCIQDIPDTNFWHYALQLNLYKYIIETKYEKIITAMYIVVFHPEKDNYERIDIPVLSKDIIKLIQWRGKNLSV